MTISGLALVDGIADSSAPNGTKGGAIYDAGGGALNLSNDVLAGNEALGFSFFFPALAPKLPVWGVPSDNAGSRLTVDSSTFTNNTAIGGVGFRGGGCHLQCRRSCLQDHQLYILVQHCLRRRLLAVPSMTPALTTDSTTVRSRGIWPKVVTAAAAALAVPSMTPALTTDSTTVRSRGIWPKVVTAALISPPLPVATAVKAWVVASIMPAPATPSTKTPLPATMRSEAMGRSAASVMGPIYIKPGSTLSTKNLTFANNNPDDVS